MSQSLLQSSGLVANGSTGTSVTVTMPGNFTAGSTAVALIDIFPATGVSAVTINGVAATKRQDALDGGGGNARSQIWVVENCPGGTNTAVITTSSGAALTCSVNEYSDTSGVLRYDKGTTSAGAGSTNGVTASITSPTWTNANTVVCVCMATDSGVNSDITASPGSPWTSRHKETNGLTLMSGEGMDQFVTSTTAVSASWTLNNTSGTGWGVAIIGLSVQSSSKYEDFADPPKKNVEEPHKLETAAPVGARILATLKPFFDVPSPVVGSAQYGKVETAAPVGTRIATAVLGPYFDVSRAVTNSESHPKLETAAPVGARIVAAALLPYFDSNQPPRPTEPSASRVHTAAPLGSIMVAFPTPGMAPEPQFPPLPGTFNPVSPPFWPQTQLQLSTSSPATTKYPSFFEGSTLNAAPPVTSRVGTDGVAPVGPPKTFAPTSFVQHTNVPARPPDVANQLETAAPPWGPRYQAPKSFFQADPPPPSPAIPKAPQTSEIASPPWGPRYQALKPYVEGPPVKTAEPAAPRPPTGTDAIGAPIAPVVLKPFFDVPTVKAAEPTPSRLETAAPIGTRMVPTISKSFDFVSTTTAPTDRAVRVQEVTAPVGAIRPGPSPFEPNWTEPPRRAEDNKGKVETAAPIGAPKTFAPSPGFANWVSSAPAHASDLPSPAATADVVGTRISPTAPVTFNTWSVEPPRVAPADTHVRDSGWVFSPLATKSTFSSWSVDAARSVPVSLHAPIEQSWFLQNKPPPPPSGFNTWSVEPPPVWKFPETRLSTPDLYGTAMAPPPPIRGHWTTGTLVPRPFATGVLVPRPGPE